MIKLGSEMEEAIERFSKTVDPLMQQLSEPIRRLLADLQPILQEWEPIFQGLSRIVEIAAPHIQKFVQHHRVVAKFGATGWLPYHLFPVHSLEECGEDFILLDQRIEDYYRTQWDKVRKDMELHMNDYHIDEEAKETFHEALSAHESGYYRCVCRVLFPEIERMIKLNICNDAGRIGSNEMIKKLTDGRSLGDFVSGKAFGLVLIERLKGHLYEQVNDEERGRFEQDPIPNRHAAIHGLVPYSTHKHSVNMIIIAFYIFQILPPMTMLPSSPE